MVEKRERQWSGKSRGGKFGYQFFAFVLKTFGISFAYCFLALVVIYFIPFAPKATRAIWQYNRRIRHLNRFNSSVELYRHYFVFGQTLIDKAAIRGGMAEKYHFQFDNYERFLEIIDHSKGIVMIGAHMGCWEAGAGFFGNYGKKINIVMLDAEHRQIKEVLEENAESSQNFKIIPLNEDVIEAMLKIKIALNNGEFVCFNGDRFIGDGNSETHFFLGDEASFPVGPFKIAAKCRVPVVFYYAMREKNRTYRFIFEEATGIQNAAEDIANQYIVSLENIVRKYPRQWFNFYDFWKQ